MKNFILISIHPVYVEKIISGAKRFEYRRRVPVNTFRQMAVYATSPVMRVVAIVNVKSVVTDSPERLWRTTRKSAGISKEHYHQYFEGRKEAHAIEIGNVEVLRDPKSLKCISACFTAPQSYRFIDESILKKLQQ